LRTERTAIDKVAKLFELWEKQLKEENGKYTPAQLLNEFENLGIIAPNS